jgi:hypothetical protein
VGRLAPCTFRCLGSGGADHLTPLDIYLGTLPVNGDQQQRYQAKSWAKARRVCARIEATSRSALTHGAIIAPVEPILKTHNASQKVDPNRGEKEEARRRAFR